jgi:arsenate reductase
MEKRIFHLGNCNTCQKIIKRLDLAVGFELQDIKSDKIKPEQLDKMAELAGSYEALFSRRAMKYRALGLNEKELTEKEYRKYILEEYTFLKRPVLILGDQIFVGNTKKTTEAAYAAIHG